MSSCTVFVFLSLMEYAMVNIILGDMVDHKPQDENLMRRITRKFTMRRPRTPNSRRRVSGYGRPHVLAGKYMGATGNREPGGP